MNDITGKKLFIGDPVCYADKVWKTGTIPRRLVVRIGTVKRFGKKQVVVAYKSEHGLEHRANRYPDDIVKLDNGGSNDG